MINRLRRRFLLVGACSVLLVFLLIFLLTCLASYGQLNDAMDTLTDAIASGGGVFPDFSAAQPPPSNWRYPKAITEETQFSTRFFTVWLDSDGKIVWVNVDAVFSISEAQARTYTEQALRKADERGWVSDYRYKVFSVPTGTAVVFVNGSMHRMMTGRFLLTSALVFTACALAILLLFILLSKRAVRPIAESYEKQKQFITDANHELKTPLTLILTNLDIVESEQGGSEWLDDIRCEAERMGLLIQSLVTLARMDEDAAKLTFSSFDLSGCILDTVSEFAPAAAERGRTLSVQVEPSVPYLGDESLIRRLISVLLDNAVKYCDAGGEIRVQAFKARHPVLLVENSCENVDQLPLDQLFDRFYRADPARTFNGSFGIGLSVAKAIVQDHHGEITAYRKRNTIGFRVDLK